MITIKLSAIASSNTYLKDLARSEVINDGTIVHVEEQLKGRGQQGAVWQSQKGKSLTFSMFKRFQVFPLSEAFSISMAVSLAIMQVLESHQIPHLAIKWPNDIMSVQKKCAGILIENSVEKDRIASSVIGIGLNVNEAQFDDLPQATSLFLESGRQFDLNTLLKELQYTLFKALDELEPFRTEELHARYEAALFRKDSISVFKTDDGQRVNGIIRGVSAEGLLQVEHEKGMALYDLKEVQLCL